MKGICPNCEKETELEFVQKEDVIEVRKELITVAVEYYKCTECGAEFDDPRSNDDPLDKAYREYRRRRGMTQPEDIRHFRKQYGLTQHEMSSLLGWGGATVSRYENGALQDESHERTLRLIMEPRNLLTLVEESSNVLAEDKRKRLINELKSAEEATCSFENIYEERFGNYEPDGLSGYRKLDPAKLFNAILFFCKGGVLKTKLNKLLFYADFKHFKEYTVSITGARYARMPFGPAPDKYTYYLAALVENGDIAVEEKEYSDEITGEIYSLNKEPDLAIFADSELKILASVKMHFQDFTAKRISDFSHAEKGSKETQNGHLISYDYAEELQL